MTLEKKIDHFPEAQSELELAWIEKNTALFSTKAKVFFGLVGRGAILVDGAAKPLGECSLFTYLDSEEFGRFDDEEINLILETYDPTEEFVLVMLKPQGLLHTYRIQIPNEEGST